MKAFQTFHHNKVHNVCTTSHVHKLTTQDRTTPLFSYPIQVGYSPTVRGCIINCESENFINALTKQQWLHDLSNGFTFMIKNLTKI